MSLRFHWMLPKGGEVAVETVEATAAYRARSYGSQPNTGAGPRIGYAVRYLATDVRQEKQHHQVILARGRDDHRFYSLQERPTAGIEQGLIVQEAFERDRESGRR